MRYFIITLLYLFVILTGGCVIQFIPDIEEEHKLIIVEGLLTDQYRTNKIKISYSLPVGKPMLFQAVKGCKVSISDDKGRVISLKEISPGIYATDSTGFQGVVGRKYTLSIRTSSNTYKSDPVEMLPVAPIDSVYYEKVIIREEDEQGLPVEGCQIYIDSHDPSQRCLFYRWDFRETWEFRIPYSVPNRICWKSAGSDKILIKNTAVYNHARVTRFPVNFISNETDRLDIKYSILVNQYSMNENEFNYWEKVKNVSENVGGLYDITPMSIPGNIYCIEDPDEPVLGYFSVSAVDQARIFIDENFIGVPNFYSHCPTDTVFGNLNVQIPGLNVTRWVIEDRTGDLPPYRVLTQYKQCADCTTEGTNIKPPYWDN